MRVRGRIPALCTSCRGLWGRGLTYLLVASSRMRMLPGRRRARARQKSCFWPCDKWISSMSVSKLPFSWIAVRSRTLLSAAKMSLSVWIPVGSAFSRTLPLNRRESWETPLMCERISRRGRWLMSTPSTVMVPLVNSIIRKRLMIMDVLPLLSC